MRINGWGSVEKISEVKDLMRMLNLFQDFYTATGRLPTFNGLLVVPDGDAKPGENKVNMKQLYDLFKNTGSRGLVSLPFLALLLHIFESSQDLKFIKDATTELYKNLSYMSLGGAINFESDAVSDFIAHLSFIIKGNTIKNNEKRQLENDLLAKKINDGRIFEPKIQDSLDDVIEIFDEPNPEHKKTIFPYAEPTVQLPDEIEDSQKRIDNDFTNLMSKINKVNDVATEHKKQKDAEDVIESIIKDPIPNNNYYWWEEDIFSKTDTQPTIDATKIIVDDIMQTTNDALKDIDIQAISDNILRNLWPFDNRNTQQLIDDDFIPIDNRTQQELEDDDYLSLESDNENRDVVTIEDVSDNEIDTPAAAVRKPPPIPLEKINEISDNILRNIRLVDNRTKQELIDDQFMPLDDRTYQQLQEGDYLSLESDNNNIIEIDTTNAWDQNKTVIAKPGPIIKFSTDYDRKVKAAKKNKKQVFQTKNRSDKHKK